MSEDRAGAPRFALVRAWWAADRSSLLRLAALFVALVSFVWLWPSLIEVAGAGPVIRNLVLHAYVLVWLSVVAIGVRSVGTREILTAFLLGVFLVPTLVFVPIWPVINWLGIERAALAVWWVPPLEEAALLAVVGLLAWRLTRRATRRPSVMDLFILGFAVGGGYAVHEDALHGRLLASWSNETLAGAFDGAYGLLFPTFGTALPGGIEVTAYHAGQGALHGLAVGVVVVLVRRWARVVWLLPVVWAYATLAHAIANYLTRNDSSIGVLTGGGHVVPIVLVLAVPTLLLLEHRRRHTTTVRLPSLGWGALRDIGRYGRGPLDTAIRSLAFGRYHRTRNAAITAAWAVPGPSTPDTSGVELWARMAFRGLGVDDGSDQVEAADRGVGAGTAGEVGAPAQDPLE